LADTRKGAAVRTLLRGSLRRSRQDETIVYTPATFVIEQNGYSRGREICEKTERITAERNASFQNGTHRQQHETHHFQNATHRSITAIAVA
jgi:hypothetical protein